MEFLQAENRRWSAAPQTDRYYIGRDDWKRLKADLAR
jgi:hypothetical protein